MTSPLYFLCQMDGGNSLYVKREDLYPLLLGGNKARIAQEYVSDMVKKQCNCMVGYGNSRSNLCRALALACVEVGVPCHIISPSDDDGTRIKTEQVVTAVQKHEQHYQGGAVVDVVVYHPGEFLATLFG